MISNSFGFKIQGILLGIILFLLADPYYMWAYQTLGYLLRLIYGFMLFLNSKKEKNSFAVIWAILLVYLSIAMGSSVIASLVFISSNIFLISAKTEFVKITYNSFYNVFVLFAALSIINFFLYVLGVPLPSHIIDPLNEIKTYNYIAYPFMVIGNDFMDFFRFEGVFDEPGALATYCFLILWVERFNLLNWKNLILIVAGVLTFSLFFFIAIGLAILIKTFSKGTNVWFRVVTIVMIVLFAYSLTIEDSITSIAIGDRLEYDEEKGFKGNNRSNATLDIYYDQVSWKDPLFFLGPTFGGVDKKKVEEMTESAAGYKSAILVNGLLGCMLYILFFLSYAKKNIKKRKDFFLFALYLFMTLYQRPFFTNIVFIFLFISIIKLYNYKLNDAFVKRLPQKGNAI
jgi:hypothetical protein